MPPEPMTLQEMTVSELQVALTICSRNYAAALLVDNGKSQWVWSTIQELIRKEIKSRRPTNAPMLSQHSEITGREPMIGGKG